MPKVSEEHRVERREQILLAAARCFAARGFHVTSMDDIIREAGLSAGAVYGYFAGKDQLIRAAARRAMELVADRVEDLAAGARSPEELVAAILELMSGLRDQMGIDPLAIALQTWGEAARDPELREIVGAGYLGVRGRLAAAVRRFQEEGVLDPAADPDETAKVLFGLVPGFVVQRQLIGDVSPRSYAAALRGLTRPGTG